MHPSSLFFPLHEHFHQVGEVPSLTFHRLLQLKPSLLCSAGSPPWSRRSCPRTCTCLSWSCWIILHPILHPIPHPIPPPIPHPIPHPIASHLQHGTKSKLHLCQIIPPSTVQRSSVASHKHLKSLLFPAALITFLMEQVQESYEVMHLDI